MIVTYAISLRDGGKTIVIPPFTAGDDEKLLEHIRTHCEKHYNSMTSPHYHLSDRDKLIILLIHH